MKTRAKVKNTARTIPVMPFSASWRVRRRPPGEHTPPRRKPGPQAPSRPPGRRLPQQTFFWTGRKCAVWTAKDWFRDQAAPTPRSAVKGQGREEGISSPVLDFRFLFLSVDELVSPGTRKLGETKGKPRTRDFLTHQGRSPNVCSAALGGPEEEGEILQMITNMEIMLTLPMVQALSPQRPTPARGNREAPPTIPRKERPRRLHAQAPRPNRDGQRRRARKVEKF